MASRASRAKPTSFHELLACLQARGSLLRVYTQNIDGLELKTGLNTFPGRDIDDGDPICVPLHGNMEQLRCDSCQSTFLLDVYLGTLQDGSLPKCLTCESTMIRRAASNLRARKAVSFLRPDFVLYGETHLLGEDISAVHTRDLRRADLLVVVGTSMKVPGVAEMIRSFATVVHKKHGKRPAPSVGTIYVDLQLSSPSRWAKIFDIWIQDDCQRFAMMVRQEMDKTTRAEGPTEDAGAVVFSSDRCSVLKQAMEMTNRRLDLRCLRNYYYVT
jgi:NAD-dependent SIR2 family protein deacetylase